MSLAFNTIPTTTIVTIYTMALCALLRPCQGFQTVGRRTTISQSTFHIISHLHSTSSSSDANEDDDKTRILFLGTPDVAATSLKTIYDQSQDPTSQYKVVGVVTQPPKRRKRNAAWKIRTPF